MAAWLKQSTAVDVALGPFVDSTDGVTAETSLTLSQADLRLKKNAGAWAQKNDTNAATHEENGWYEVALNTTDTNTLGILILACAESGALPVWREFLVLPAAVYDSLVAGTDTLPADVTQWNGTNVATPDTAGYPKVTAKSGTGTGELNLSSGRIKADISHWNASAIATPDTAGYPKVTVKSGTGTGEISLTSGVAAVNTTQWKGTDADTAIKAQLGFPDEGTAQAGAGTTITLRSGASASDDAYNGFVIVILAGTGKGQARTITDYVGSTKVATVDTWTTNPDSTSVYVVLGG